MSRRNASLAATLSPEVRLKVFYEMLHQARLAQPVPEFRFDLKRKWRFDFGWPAEKVALEVEGGVWTSGRHTRGSGFLKDVEKYNRAAVLGWRVLRCVPSTLATAETIDALTLALAPVPA